MHGSGEMTSIDKVPSWDSARMLPEPPPEMANIYDTVHTPWGRYWECGHSGWDLLIAWLAGPETLARYPESEQQYWTVTRFASGKTKEAREPETPENRAIAIEAKNSVLREAGLPSIPDGYRWFQVLPNGLTAVDVTSAANRAVAASGLPEGHGPGDEIPFVATEIRRLYQSG